MLSGNRLPALTPSRSPIGLAVAIFSALALTSYAAEARASQCELGDARSRVEVQDANGRYGSKVQITVDEVTEIIDTAMGRHVGGPRMVVHADGTTDEAPVPDTELVEPVRPPFSPTSGD